MPDINASTSMNANDQSDPSVSPDSPQTNMIPKEVSKLAEKSDPNDLQMIDLCKDIMIHERDKNSAYTRVLSEQIVFLKSELQRKQTTIETLLKMLMQKDQSASAENEDPEVAKIQRMVQNRTLEDSNDNTTQVSANDDKTSKTSNSSKKINNTTEKKDEHGTKVSRSQSYHKSRNIDRPFVLGETVSSRLEYFDSIGSSVVKQRRGDGSAVGEKKKGGIGRFERYGYKLINTDMGQF